MAPIPSAYYGQSVRWWPALFSLLFGGAASCSDEALPGTTRYDAAPFPHPIDAPVDLAKPRIVDRAQFADYAVLPENLADACTSHAPDAQAFCGLLATNPGFSTDPTVVACFAEQLLGDDPVAANAVAAFAQIVDEGSPDNRTGAFGLEFASLEAAVRARQLLFVRSCLLSIGHCSVWGTGTQRAVRLWRDDPQAACYERWSNQVLANGNGRAIARQALVCPGVAVPSPANTLAMSIDAGPPRCPNNAPCPEWMICIRDTCQANPCDPVTCPQGAVCRIQRDGQPACVSPDDLDQCQVHVAVVE